MKKLYLLPALAALCVSAAQAQTKDVHMTEHDPAVATKDSLIKVQIYEPTVAAAGDQAPDWTALTKTITQKYDSISADRFVTKAKIYYYYGKDWPQFTAGIVHYTNNYEEATDYKLLNLNAGMILKSSTDPKEWAEALRWSKAAVDSDPNNVDYKATYTALQAKIQAK